MNTENPQPIVVYIPVLEPKSLLSHETHVIQETSKDSCCSLSQQQCKTEAFGSSVEVSAKLPTETKVKKRKYDNTTPPEVFNECASKLHKSDNSADVHCSIERTFRDVSDEHKTIPRETATGVETLQDIDIKAEKRNIRSSATSNDYAKSSSEVPSKLRESDEDGERVLVNQDKLNKRWLETRINGKGNEEFKRMCINICSYIKKKSSDILHVWPAYDSINNETVEFIIITKKEMNVKQLNLKYAAVVRLVNTFSKEAMAVTDAEENDKTLTMSIQDSDKIKKAINNHAAELMQKHRYLSIISGSGIRSRGFRNDTHKLVPEVCIVMYVHSKGKIPVDETELPKTIEGIAVDVREGEFQTFGFAQEYQDPLCIGCQIQCEKYGTLGCFLHHPKYGLCAITCAHVVLNDEEIHELCGQKTKTWSNGEKNVYQPITVADNSNSYCGQVVETMIKYGDETTSGVDLAVVKIERRPPDGGLFPETGEDDIEYHSGHISRTVIHSHNQVMKFGKETNKTLGDVQFSGTVVKKIDLPLNYEVSNQQQTYILHGQLEVKAGLSGPFATHGDSGAPVFKTDVYNDWVCIGMVVGGFNSNVIVTPVSSILSELGVSEFQNFKVRKLERSQNEIQVRLGAIGAKQDEMSSQLNQMQEALTLISDSLGIHR